MYLYSYKRMYEQFMTNHCIYKLLKYVVQFNLQWITKRNTRNSSRSGKKVKRFDENLYHDIDLCLSIKKLLSVIFGENKFVFQQSLYFFKLLCLWVCQRIRFSIMGKLPKIEFLTLTTPNQTIVSKWDLSQNWQF